MRKLGLAPNLCMYTLARVKADSRQTLTAFEREIQYGRYPQRQGCSYGLQRVAQRRKTAQR